jgi:hypothetical protein
MGTQEFSLNCFGPGNRAFFYGMNEWKERPCGIQRVLFVEWGS